MDVPGLERNVDVWIDAALAMTRVERSHLSWKHELVPGEVREHLRAENLSGVAGAVYAAFAAREGVDACVIKENHLWDHAHRIRAVYPETRVIYLHRDGRDVACSVKRVPSHDQHITYIAREWRDEQRRARLVHADLAAVGASHPLRYEDLIEDPEATLRALCSFLDLEFVPAMLAFHESDDSKSEAAKTAYWKNLSKPVQSENRGRFHRELSSRELALFESEAGDQLDALGYARAWTGAPARVRRVQRYAFAVWNAWQRRRQRDELLAEPGRRERAALIASLRATAATELARRAAPRCGT